MTLGLWLGPWVWLHYTLYGYTTNKDCGPSGAPLVGQRTMGPGPADLNVASTNKDCDPSGAPLVGHRLWGQGQGWWHMVCGGIACG